MPLYRASTFKDPLFITIVTYVLSPPVVVVVVDSSLEDSHLLYHHRGVPLAMDIMMVEE
jgi:hypothetical protein